MTAPWVDDTWLAVDTETTGVDVFSDRVVEVAAVQVQADGTTAEPYRAIVNPGIEIPDGAAAIHGITTARAHDEGIAPAEALEQLAALLFAWGHRPVVMFNARFDWPILICEAERHGVDFPVFAPVLDPFLIDRMLDKYRKGSRKLVAVAQHYAVDFAEDEAHGALADAVAAARVMRAVLGRYPQVGERSLASVYLRQVRGHEAWREGFVEYKRRQDPTFNEAPGWPFPAKTTGGLPVITEPTQREATQPLAQGPEAGEGVVPPLGATSSPAAASPAEQRRLTPADVARLAGDVFKADGDAAPRGHKTRTLERLRHAITHVATGGKATSLNDLDPAELVTVAQHLAHIRDGEIVYGVDGDGVTFVLLATGEEHAVTWADLQHNPAA